MSQTNKAYVNQLVNKVPIVSHFPTCHRNQDSRLVKNNKKLNINTMFNLEDYSYGRVVVKTTTPILKATEIVIENKNNGKFNELLLKEKNKLLCNENKLIVKQKIISNLYEVDTKHCIIMPKKKKMPEQERTFEFISNGTFCYDTNVEVGGAGDEESSSSITILVQKNNFIELYLSPKTVVSYTALPKGLNLSGGRIYGTVLESGEFNVTVKYEDNTTSRFLITVPFYQRVL